MHAKARIYMLLVILLQFIMSLNAEDGMADYHAVGDKASQCFVDDIKINDPNLVAKVSRNVWYDYGGCGVSFKVTCVQPWWKCAQEGASVTVQAINVDKESVDNHFTITFEAWHQIALPIFTTPFYIEFTQVKGPEDAIVADTSDEILEEGMMADMSDEEPVWLTDWNA